MLEGSENLDRSIEGLGKVLTSVEDNEYVSNVLEPM